MKETGIHSFLRSLRSIWTNLDRSIYVGDRLKSHKRALTLVSIVTTVLGLVLIIIDVTTGKYSMMVAAFITSMAGAACAL